MGENITKDYLDLYKRHLQACGISKEEANSKERIPDTRFDLTKYYTDILAGDIVRPAWADDPRYI